MTINESDHLAAENLRLRRDVAGLRQALNAVSDANDALRRQLETTQRECAERIEAAAERLHRITQSMREIANERN